MSETKVVNAAATSLEIVSAPLFLASNFGVQYTMNEFSVIGRDMMPAIDPSTGNIADEVVARNVFILKMNPQSAKDLLVMLEEAVNRYEDSTKYSLITDRSIAANRSVA